MARRSQVEVVELVDATFEAATRGRLPLLVAFTATWCSPSRAMRAELAALAASVGELARVAVVDIDQAPAVAMRSKLTGLPTLALYQGGKRVGINLGSLKRRAIRSWLIAALDKEMG